MTAASPNQPCCRCSGNLFPALAALGRARDNPRIVFLAVLMELIKWLMNRLSLIEALL